MAKILVTNDDGINSDGIAKLEEAMRGLGEVFVVAPAFEMSGASHSLTLSRPLRIRQIDARHWTVDGTPTDCVTLALNTILKPEQMPDICVSGINMGGNLGDDATYSGTVAGALEATILGLPGLAFSLVGTENFDFTHAARFAREAARKVLQDRLPEGTLLNINFPPGPIKGVRVTTQGIRNAAPVITRHVDPRAKPYYWIGQKVLQDTNADGTDYYAVRQGFVSVTPMRADMTNHAALDRIADWGEMRGDDASPAPDETPVLEHA